MDRLICARWQTAFRAWLLSLVMVAGLAGCDAADEPDTMPGGAGGTGGIGGTAATGGSGGVGGTGGVGGVGGTGGAESRCGDGDVDDGEECDDGDENSDSQAGACRTDCSLATCGDGVRDPGEGCDDGDANSDTVPDACRTSCQPASCGDGVPDAGEACDGEVGVSCSDIDPGFVGGVAACNMLCAIDSSGCHGPEICGNGIDDDRDGATDCADEDCQADLELCAACGDGIRSGAELCDSADLGGVSCEDLGFELGGDLACASCAFVTAGCNIPEVCTNGVDDDGDGAIDCADSDCAVDLVACPVCGDGLRTGNEECDDGGVSTGDGCDSSCNIEVSVCTMAPDIYSAGTVSNQVIQVSGTTVGALDQLSGMCAATTGAEQIYSLTLTGPADLFAKVGPPEGGPGVFSIFVRGYCLNPATELGCSNDMIVEQDPVTSLDLLDVPAGQPIYFVVDSAAGGEGAFELSAIVAPILGAGELCDRFGFDNRCSAGLACLKETGSIPARYLCQ